MGAEPAERAFVFENEQLAHPVQIAPFAIARAAVTNGEFAAFVADGGYHRRELWSAEGWTWRNGARAEHPVYWAAESSGGAPGWRPSALVAGELCGAVAAACRPRGRRSPDVHAG